MPAMDMTEALVNDLKTLEKGIFVYDAFLKTEVRVNYNFLALPDKLSWQGKFVWTIAYIVDCNNFSSLWCISC